MIIQLINALLGNDDSIAGDSKERFVAPKKFPNKTFDTVSLHRVADFFANGDPKSYGIVICFTAGDNKMLGMDLLPFKENLLKIRSLCNSL